LFYHENTFFRVVGENQFQHALYYYITMSHNYEILNVSACRLVPDLIKFVVGNTVVPFCIIDVCQRKISETIEMREGWAAIIRDTGYNLPVIFLALLSCDDH